MEHEESRDIWQLSWLKVNLFIYSNLFNFDLIYFTVNVAICV